LLAAIASDVGTPQSTDEQRDKAESRRPANAPGITEFAHLHAATRVEQGFTLTEMVAEYRAMRASLTRVLVAEQVEGYQLVRLGEAMDQALVESICWYIGLVERGRDLFLAIFSHDLRNPLNAAMLSAEVLLGDESLGSDSTIAAVRVRNSVARMGRMLDDLLDFTRTRLGSRLPTTRADTDLRAVVDRTVDEIRAANPRRDVQVDAPDPVRGSWDGERLTQMLGNLLGNAIQHGDPARPVRVSLRPEHGHALLAVHNDGPAIQPEFMDKIFDPLVRGAVQEAERRTNRASLGLGLYISRQIAKAHGGDITVTSAQDTGTTFLVRLPLASVAGAQPRPA
jgi:signal transduction histidine kinase